MNRFAQPRARLHRHVKVIVLTTLSLFMAACADRPSPDATGVRSNEPPYPVLMTDSPDRKEGALADWTKIAGEQGLPSSPAPDLQPVTSTIRRLPAGTVLQMPKLGSGPTLSEDEVRDALRRFIGKTSNLLGAEPQQLSLVQRTDLADGTKQAHYEQRPFRYPLRGDFGKLDITFTSDRRILQVTSTCIPDVELLQRAAVGIRPRWTADKIPTRVLGRTFTYRDTAGEQPTLSIGKSDSLTIRELVIYPTPRSDNPAVLEFHLCWEISVGPDPGAQLIYLDAVTDELVAVRHTPK